MSRRSEPLIPRFKITLELEPRAVNNAEARHAAERAAAAIEQLMCEREAGKHLQLHTVKRVLVEQVDD
jgi:hypothetical protein